MKEVIAIVLVTAMCCATLIIITMLEQREATIRASFCPHIYEPAMSMPIAPRKK